METFEEADNYAVIHQISYFKKKGINSDKYVLTLKVGMHFG